MTLNNEGSYGVPGILAAREAAENDLYWSRFQQIYWNGSVIDGASRDVGNTGNTVLLRAGLLMGRVTATTKLKEWNPTATDGTETIFGVLGADVNTQRLNANLDRFYGFIMVGGGLKTERLVVPGTTALGLSGNALEHLALAQLQGRFHFSNQADEYTTFGGYKNVIAKVADYTVLELDNETLFTNKGDVNAINFTLPTVAKKGLHYAFYASEDFDLKITAGTADTLIVDNDVAADSISFETATEIVGGMFEVFGDGALWMVRVSLSHASQTVTIVS